MSIQAVFFDMGGTIETFQYNREMRLKATPMLYELLISRGISLNLENDKFFILLTDGLERYHKWAIDTLIELPSAQVWKEYILYGYPQFFSILDDIGEELMYWVDMNFYERTLRPEMPAVLEQIKMMGLTIGLISNINSLGQVPDNLKKYGIYQYFDTVVTSSQYRRRKPDPSIFHRAAFLAKVPTSNCVYVGDRILRDINGARRAGYALAIQIKHDFEHGEKEEGSQPDAVISSMDELIPLIQNALQAPNRHTLNLKIKAILFDAGDILYYRPRRGIHFKEFLEKYGIIINGNYDKPRELKQLAYEGNISREGYFRELLRCYGVTDPMIIDEGTKILVQADDDVVFFDGVHETLRLLKKQGYFLGIITDSAVPVYLKLSWFKKGGFEDVWDSYISSQEVGVQKPDPKIYKAALDQLGLFPHQAVFVGHSPEELDGANEIGMGTIAFNQDQGAIADFYVDKFSDIPVCAANFTKVLVK